MMRQVGCGKSDAENVRLVLIFDWQVLINYSSIFKSLFERWREYSCRVMFMKNQITFVQLCLTVQ